ncbi:hypothetical protein [Clavibacter michiganensis]|uniref:hypothetical protein n=1 Tax=Clavibacter michiganensis TaxID=28447 RepID=UPI001BE03544|nr:hypothetical protein [Clavibacter michiganensis]MBT1635622.1 hypothetical protein [Clavibacter michiganensis]
MPTLPLEPSPDRARSADPHADASAASGTAHPSAQPTGAGSDRPGSGAADAAAPAPEAAPTEVERARWRDRRTGLIALIVVTIALWAVIAAAVGFATTM